MVSALNTSESFIRALRATSDPPEPGWPEKIEIARIALENSDFYVPAKSQVIGEWILSSLSRSQQNQ